jgi:hypothetical protein
MRAGAFVVNFVGPLCRKWPETARFDKVFDKGLRQSGLNRWFWDKLYLPWSLREQTERGVYAASAWRGPCDVAELPERQESADDEAA